jgi:hypothetical protein
VGIITQAELVRALVGTMHILKEGAVVPVAPFGAAA